jgi:ABC-type metal ion transport system, periplasmic component/surface adhesin
MPNTSRLRRRPLLRRLRPILLGLTLCLILMAGNARAGMPVFVSILPQKFFVQKIAGDLADVSVLVMPGASPHTYEPSPRQMAELTGARAYFSIGVTFEDVWLSRIRAANPDMPVIPTDAGIVKIPMPAHGHAEHDMEKPDGHEPNGHEPEEHEEETHHDQGILDPHVWLSPDGARLVAENICKGLISLDPAHADTYRANTDALLREIDRVDAEAKHVLASLPEGQRSFMVFHPSWGYFARHYGLTQIPIESEGREPSPRGLAEVIEQARALGITVIFVQPQFSEKSASVIAAEIGARIAVLDPLAEDWTATMTRAAEAIGQAAR